jgi:hypothetical protein
MGKDVKNDNLYCTNHLHHVQLGAWLCILSLVVPRYHNVKEESDINNEI